jgi:hypothetical protein
MFVFLQFFHSPVDRFRRVFHATLQVDPVRLKQYNIQKIAPVFGEQARVR